jgi:hypothetical protein
VRKLRVVSSAQAHKTELLIMGRSEISDVALFEEREDWKNSIFLPRPSNCKFREILMP